MADSYELILRGTDLTAPAHKSAQANIKETEKAVHEMTKRAQDDLKKIDKSIQLTASEWKGLGKGALVVSGVITGALGYLVKAASDAEETGSKLNNVFSNMQDQANAAAKELADGYGLSELASKKMLSSTGDLLTGLNFTQDSALDLSKQVTALGADLASFQNFAGGAEGASESITKALLGERESMKSLGVVIRQTDVDAKKLELAQQGLVFTSENQANALATLAIIQEQSKNAIGDFSRTQESAANQMRIFKAEIVDAAVNLGVALLPAATKIISVLAGLVDTFNNLSPGIQAFIAKALVATAALTGLYGIMALIKGLELSKRIADVTSSLVGMKNMILAINPAIFAIIAAAGLLYVAWKNNLGGIQEKTQAVIEFLKETWAKYSENIHNIIQTLRLTFQKMGEFFIDVIKSFADKARPVFEAFKKYIMNVVDLITAIFKKDWEGALSAVWAGIQSFVKLAIASFKLLIVTTAKLVYEMSTNFGQTLGFMVKLVVAFALDSLEALVALVVNGLKAFDNFGRKLGEIIYNIPWRKGFNQMLEALEQALSNATSAVSQWAKNAWQAIKAALSGNEVEVNITPSIDRLSEQAKDIDLTGIFDNIKIDANFERTKGVLGDLKTSITDALNVDDIAGQAEDDLNSLGGAIDDVANQAGNLNNEMGNIADDGAAKASGAQKEVTEDLQKVQDELDKSILKYDDLQFKVSDALAKLEQDHKEKIGSINSDLEKLNEELGNLESGYQSDIGDVLASQAEKFIDQEQKIKNIQADIADEQERLNNADNGDNSRLTSLQEQLNKEQDALASFNTDAEGFSQALSEARRRFQLTDFERFVEDSEARKEELTNRFNLRKAQIEEEILALEEARDKEIKIFEAKRKEYEKTRDALIAFKDSVIENFDIMQANATTAVDNINAKLAEMERAFNRMKAIQAEMSDIATGGASGIEGRAVGGPVFAGQTYMVGENGREYFTPSTDGFITPNDRIVEGGVSNDVSVSFGDIVIQGGGNLDPASLQEALVGQVTNRIIRALQSKRIGSIA